MLSCGIDGRMEPLKYKIRRAKCLVTSIAPSVEKSLKSSLWHHCVSVSEGKSSKLKTVEFLWPGVFSAGSELEMRAQSPKST